jgi:eukaryotic-like serine/threonine-protein kinase
MVSKLTISSGQCSDAGIKPDNEDFHGITEPKEPQLTHKGIAIAIADGMSGSDAGKVASQASVIGFMSDYYSTPDSWSVKHAAQKILSTTNSWLYSTGQARYQSTKGLVSTLSILILKSNTAHIFHVGDTRIYRLSEGHFEQLTHDHRIWVNDKDNYLNRAMGIEPHLDVDYRSVPLQLGDIFFLSTDGVHDFVPEKQLKRLIIEYSDAPQRAAEAIMEAARAGESDDNMTCQLVRVESLPLQQEDELLRQNANRPFPPPLEPGMILDGYRIERELHASKRTQIYLAFDTRTEKKVILKTPSVNYEDDPVYIEHFLHEEWAGKRINHENVLQVLETDRPKKWIYYVTEYIEGQTLREWMDANPKPEMKQVCAIVEQIARGLRAFHRLEMLHQDLKPENVMLDGFGKVKIIDFGSVKIAGIAELAPQTTDEPILGTLNYTAPEYLLGRRGDTRSDLYSLAVITYEMLNGALPFGREMPEKPDRIKLSRLEYVPSMQLNPMVPAWIDGALKKALSINPNQRHEDLFEFMHDLKHPNPRFLSEQPAPIIEKNPLLFWQAVSALLLLSNLILVYLLSR